MKKSVAVTLSVLMGLAMVGCTERGIICSGEAICDGTIVHWKADIDSRKLTISAAGQRPLSPIYINAGLVSNIDTISSFPHSKEIPLQRPGNGTTDVYSLWLIHEGDTVGIGSFEIHL